MLRWGRCAIVAAGLLMALPALATQTENRGIHAVPAPGRVAVDGKLDDWDLSGQTLMCYDIETLRDVYSAQVAMMYDADGLYVGIHWKAPRPMSNPHDPRYQAAKAWAADAVQLRIKTDRICHVTAWYYAPGREPAMQIEYGKSLTDPFDGGGAVLLRTEGWKLNGGAEMAFAKDADGKGYMQEMKLPWKLITNSKAYRAADTFNCGFELLWGSADWPEHRYADNLMPGATSREFFWTAFNAWGPVVLEPRGRLKLPMPDYMLKALRPPSLEQGPVPIAYTLPRDARVTVAIDDEQGRRVRNLVPALPRQKGRNVERWDGLNDEGKAVAPGKYRVKVLYHDPIHVSWTMSFANPGDPTWSTPDGRGAFYADHTAPQAAAAAGDYVALACPIGEGGPPIIGLDMDGKKLWGVANRTAFDGGHMSLATDGKRLWVASEGKQSTIYRLDMATGRYAPWDREARDEHGAPYKVLDLVVSGLPGMGAAEKPPLNLAAIAYRAGTLAICLARENRLKLLDAETGDVRREVAIPAPLAVTFGSDGRPIVLSQGRLLRVADDGSTTPFTAAPYADGVGLASDPQGCIYLSVRGPEQNVKVFSPDGAPIGEIGKRGGRPAYGPFEDGAMLDPAGLAVDGKGRVWVTEEAHNPKRTSVWSRDGKLVRDLVGSAHYSGAGAINPDDPTMGFSDDTVYRLDLKAGSSRPVYSLARRSDPSDLFPPSVESRCRVVSHGADTLVYTTFRTGAIRCMVRHDGQWRSAAHVGTVLQRNDPEDNANYESPLFAGHVGQVYAWADRNGDGLVQPDELTFASLEADGKPLSLRSYYWGNLPGPDGAIAYLARDRQQLVRCAIKGYTACGAPIYDIAHPEIVTVAGGLLGQGNGEGMIMSGAGGRVYLNQDPIVGVAGGKVLGSYPSHHTSVHGSHTARAASPGFIIGPSSILGTADFGGKVGEVFDMNGNLGENYLFTSDCLLVQTLFKDVRGSYDMPGQAVRGMPFDNTTAGGESFGGNFVRTRDGKVYLTIGGTDARVLEVTGLDTLRRLPDMTVAYTPAQYRDALKVLAANSAKTAAPRIYTVRRAAAPPADGKADAWPDLLSDAPTALDIQDGPDQRYGRVEARYDADNLYLAYRVFAPRNEMRNAGQDYRLLFKTGDAVDLQLAPVAGSNQPSTDTRLLLTVMDGHPAAVLYRRTVPGTPAASRVEFGSPVRKVTFDRVERAPDVRTATAPASGGYLVTAAVPWKLLGIAPRSGLKLRADVGVLFADNGGTTTVSRQYWSNKATGLVNDVPSEADLTPGLWGEWTIE